MQCALRLALRRSPYGDSALAGWLKGPERKGKVRERSLHARWGSAEER